MLLDLLKIVLEINYTLDSIVGDALKNAGVQSTQSQPTSTTSSAFADLGSLSSFSTPSQPTSSSQMSSGSGYGNTSSSSISSARTISSNNEYKMVDLDIPPFLRRNKD